MPTALARETLLAGGKIGIEDFEPLGLKVLADVKDAVMDVGMAQGLLAKRSNELVVVWNAPSAKVDLRHNGERRKPVFPGRIRLTCNRPSQTDQLSV